MNFDILRQRILEKAIQGKLVPQLESEPEVAQISETLDDVPFTVPEKWKWVRILDAACINPKVIATDSNINVSFIPMAAVSAGYLNYIALKEEKPWKTVKNGYTKFADRDILIAKITPCFQNRKSAIAHSLINGIGCGSSEFHVLRTNENILDQNYLLLFLKSPWFIAYGVENFKGTAGQQRLGTSELKNCRLPLPPLSEQRRIVAKTEKLFEQISRAEEAYNEISGPLSERFRQLCLEKAIQGKLVPQLESEPEVEQVGDAPEDVPFAIPEKWKWVNLHSTLKAISDGSHNPPPNVGHGVPVLSAKNVINGIIDTNSVTRWTTEEQWSIEDKKIHIQSGDVLLTIVGTIGRTAVVPNDCEKFMLQRSVCVMKPKECVNPEFLALILNSPSLFEWIMDHASGTAQKGIYLKTVKQIPIPLPSIEEQRRIVAKLNELLGSISQLEQTISTP